MRILVVEDHRNLADVVAKGLRRNGMAVDVAGDGAEALEKALTAPYDVIVLDRDLPTLSGDAICQELVATQNPARIVMLTAAGTTDDLIEGLGIGADDYLAKPFAFDELVARIHAAHRRLPNRQPPIIRHMDLVVDVGRRRVTRAERIVGLTRKEFGVLHMLLTADGTVVSAEELLDKVWDEHADPFSNVVRVVVATLRGKLGDPPLIETVIGVGYRIGH